MVTQVIYPTKKVTSVNTKVRVALLGECSGRVPTKYTVTAQTPVGASVTDMVTGAPVLYGDTTVTLAAGLSGDIPNRAKVVFGNGITARLSAAATAGASTLAIDSAQSCGTCDSTLVGTEIVPTGTGISYTAGSLTAGTEYLSVAPLVAPLWAGEIFEIGGVRVEVGADTPAGASELETTPTPDAIADGATGEAYGSYYVAAATDASPSSAPKLVDGTSYSSGRGYVQDSVGNNFTIAFTFFLVEGDPGSELFKEILYGKYKGREIYFWVERECGEKYDGAAIPTTGDQQSPVQSTITVNSSLQVQGEINYTAQEGAPEV